MINKQQALNEIHGKYKPGERNMFLINTNIVMPCISIDGVDLFFSDEFSLYFSRCEKVSMQHKFVINYLKKEKRL